MQTTDVAIIGGGVIGCSIAYQLAHLGLSRGVVFERKHVASGATGLCPGGIRQQFDREAECQLAQRSMRFFESANEILEPESPFFLERSGYLFVADSEALLTRFRQNVAMQNEIGVPSRIVNASEIVEIVPGVSVDGILGGAFCGEDGFLEDCDGFTRALLRRFRDRGFELQLQPVLNLSRDGGEWRVETPTTTWISKQVVIAAGVDSPGLAASAGLHLPITVERRRLAYTEPLGKSVMPPLVVSLERGFAGKQLRNGVFYIGWLGETPDSDDLRFIERALSAGTTFVPEMESLPVRRVVTGFYDSTPDHRPILGPVRDYEGLHLATGFSGHGFMLAPAVGEIIANAIIGSKADRLLADFALERFATHTASEGLQI